MNIVVCVRVQVMNLFLFGSYSTGTLTRRVVRGLSRESYDEKLLMIRVDTCSSGVSSEDGGDDDNTKCVSVEVIEDLFRVIPYSFVRPVLSTCVSEGVAHSSKKRTRDYCSDDSGSESDDYSSECSSEEDSNHCTTGVTIDQSVCASSNATSGSTAPTTSLVQWEKHTKGIGSRLMAKMGFKE
jgi:hypothetical protein